MKYIHAAMLLHEADKDITEANVRDVLETANADVNEHRVKALVAALEDVDIDDALDVPGAVRAADQPVTREATDDVGEDDADESDSAEESDDATDDDGGADDGAEGLGAMFD